MCYIFIIFINIADGVIEHKGFQAQNLLLDQLNLKYVSSFREAVAVQAK